jgi:thioester reductase-like protein
MKDDKKIVFLTGATGLVGSYLLKLLLQEGHKVYVLARRKDNQAARTRVTEVLKFWDKNILSRKACNLVVLDGDITKRNLGLDKQRLDILKNKAEEIFHSAAVTQFNWPLEKIRKVNVEGTRNILELADKCREKGRLNKVNHISTAYVCGDYKGIFRENDLDVGQGFNTAYEQSKFEAEKLVEEYRKRGLWIDIFRPPLVIGESNTGKTSTFKQSVYQLLHMLSLGLFDYLPGQGLSVNMVFVDDFCKSVYKISYNISSINKNYHTFNSGAIPFEIILDISSKYLNFQKPKLVSRSDFIKNKSTPAQKLLLQNNILIISNNVRLDSRMTNNVLKHYNFEFSNLNRDLFLNQLQYCTKNHFLRRNNEKSLTLIS